MCLLAQTSNGKAVRKHSLSQNEQFTHARPESTVHVIGSALGGVSINTEVWPTKLSAVAAEFLPTNSSRCAQIIVGLADSSGGYWASWGAVLNENGQDNKVPVEGGVLLMSPDQKIPRLQYAMRLN